MRSICIFILAALFFSSGYACEEVCKSGTVSKFMEKYTTNVLEPIFISKEKELRVSHSLNPLRNAIQLACPVVMKTNVFGYFIGRCQRHGIEPEGCPIPDCSSVCGTPGSMVHFYTKLALLVYESMSSCLKSLIDPTSPTYRQIQALVEQKRESTKKETPIRFQPRNTNPLPILYMRQPFEIPDVKRDRHPTDVSSVQSLVLDMEKLCGSNLKHCKWAGEMTSFILQYP